MTNTHTQSLFNFLPLILLSTLIHQAHAACHIKINFSSACILVGSCENNQDTKYIQPLAISELQATECDYEHIQFEFNETPCTVKLERLDSAELDKQTDTLSESFKDLGQNETEDQATKDKMGSTDMAVLEDCGLESNLEAFNSMSYDKENNKVVFVHNENRLFII